MCNRVANTSGQEAYERRFGRYYKPNIVYKKHWHSSAFAIPGLPVITQKNPDEIDIFEWPLIPVFAKDEAHAKKLRFGKY